MAIKRLGSIAQSERMRNPRERALHKKVKADSLELTRTLQRMIDNSTTLDVLGTLAEQQQKQVSRQIQQIIDRALRNMESEFDKFEAKLSVDLFEESIASYEAGAKLPLKQVGLRGTFDLRNPTILEALEDRANMLAGDVAESTFDAMKEVIAETFFEQGLSTDEVAKALKNEFDFLTTVRSRTIARTETLVITEQAAFEQYAALGAHKKRWIATIHDERTREAHREAHNQEVDLFDPFIVGGEELLHPGDPNGSPENIINCRCTDGPVVDTADIGNPWLGE